MSEPLTKDDFHKFTDTFETTLTRTLNERFEHYEQRSVAREEVQHKEIMNGFGQVIDTLDEHIDERFNRLEKLLILDREVRTLNDRFTELAKRTGHADLAIPTTQPAA